LFSNDVASKQEQNVFTTAVKFHYRVLHIKVYLKLTYIILISS